MEYPCEAGAVISRLSPFLDYLTMNQLESITDWLLVDPMLVFLCFFPSWVNNFGHEGLGLLLDALEKLLDKKQWVYSCSISVLFFKFNNTRYVLCNHNSSSLPAFCTPFRQENIDKRNQHKLIQCLKAFMNNKVCMKKRNSMNQFLTFLVILVHGVILCACTNRWRKLKQGQRWLFVCLQ